MTTEFNPITINNFNIVDLIETNPITRLTQDYQNKLIDKIKNSFTPTQQQMFVASFYCFLNFNEYNDYVINFDDVWKWCGFSRKSDGKRVLEKHFTIDIDYKVQNFAPPTCGKVNGNTFPATSGKVNETVNKGQNTFTETSAKVEMGRPIENIYLTINAFKKFCMKANTKKADEVHEYYIKLEHVLNQTIAEENAILRNQIKNKDNVIIKTKEDFLKLQEAHNRILYKRRVHKLRKGKCFYIVKNKDVTYKTKGGKTLNLNSRKSGYQTYFDPDFLYICFTEHYSLIEKCVKTKYSKYIATYGEEWIIDISENEVIEFVENLIKMLEIDCEIYRCLEDIIVDEEKDQQNIKHDEEIEEIEEDIEEESSDEMIEDDIDSAEFIYTKEIKKEKIKKEKVEDIDIDDEKRCNKCKIMKKMSFYNKDNTKKDGKHTICRDCEKENKKILKENKKAQMLKDNITEKKCKTCNKVQDVSEYTQHLSNADGYCPNCKSCSRNMDNERRRLDKENKVYYECNRCNTKYSRKDTLARHKKSCVI
jgi:hypothetical protein